MSRTITIKETASTTVHPDYTVLSFTIETTEKKYSDAMEKENMKIRQLSSALLDAGFDEEVVKTVNYNVRANYNYGESRKGHMESILTGYTCTHRLKVEFSYDTELLGKALDTISVCLASPQLDISFIVKERDAVNEELLKTIAANARKKAEIMCTTAGASLGKLLKVEYHESARNMGIESNTSYSMGETEILRPPLPQTAPKACGVPVPPPVLPQLSIQPKDITVSDSASFVWEVE